MKYLVLLAVVCGALWWLRQQRPQSMRSRAASHKAGSTPQPMVACTHCGVHLPQHDALTGAHGVYCCTEHRDRHEN